MADNAIQVTVALVMLAASSIAVVLLWTRNGATRQPITPWDLSITLNDRPRIGERSSPFVMVVFSSFLCDSCSRFWRETWPDVQARLVDTGLLQVSYRSLPIEANPLSWRAAELTACAATQDRFWVVADTFFARENALTERTIDEAAQWLNPDTPSLESCMASSASRRVDEDVALAASAGIRKPPTYLIGRLQTNDSVRVAGIMYGVIPADRVASAVEALRTNWQPQ